MGKEKKKGQGTFDQLKLTYLGIFPDSSVDIMIFPLYSFGFLKFPLKKKVGTCNCYG